MIRSVIRSVRARLALWYAGAFAVLLGVFASAAFVFLARTTQARVDEYLTETVEAVSDEITTALDSLPAHTRSSTHARLTADAVDRAAAVAALGEFRFRDIGIAVFDAGVAPPAGGRAAAPNALPLLLAADAGGARSHSFGGSTAGQRARAADVVRRAARAATLVVETVGTGSAAERVLAVPVAAGGHALVIGASQSLRAQATVLAEARDALLIGLPIALLLATTGGYVLARRSLRPVDEMATQARRIGAGTLHERLLVVNPGDELGRLALVLNGLLERLEQSFERQRQFMADASHELRTPIAIVRGEAELALARPRRDAAEYEATLTRVRDEARHLTRAVDDLFLLARADAGDQPLDKRLLYLEELVADCVHSARTLVETAGVELLYSPDAEVALTADERLLRRLVLNLVHNAVKFTPRGGRIVVTVERLRRGGDGAEEVARVAVTDTGPGISAAAQERIFERFYRAHPAVDDADGGSVGDASGAGLGLPIARWIAQAHGGWLGIASTSPSGTTMAAEIPIEA